MKATEWWPSRSDTIFELTGIIWSRKAEHAGLNRVFALWAGVYDVGEAG
jgi:hypothetical protein